MTIKFINNENKEITNEEALIIGNYDKVYEENNAVKKAEHYSNSILTYINYYTSSEESEQSVITMLGIVLYNLQLLKVSFYQTSGLKFTKVIYHAF